jgi:SOS response regulatory protein OraA/RecX
VQSEALDIAARALAHRDRSEADLRRRLAAKGVPEGAADAAVETLRRLGAVDDARFAGRTAAALAARGFGDAAIVFRLEQEGVDHDLAAEAVSALEPESDRAAALAARGGTGPRVARRLSGRGFSADSVEHAMASVAQSEPAELG